MQFSSVKTIYQLRRLRRHDFSINDLLAMLELDRKLRQPLVVFLDSLVVEGLLKHMRRGRYAVRRPLNLIHGVLKRQSAGHAFVVSDRDDDMYVASFRLAGAMDGDKVTVLELPGRRGARPEGWVVEVSERCCETVLGCCQQGRHGGQVVFRSEQAGLTFEVVGSGNAEELVDQVAVLKIDRYPSAHNNGTGHIVDLLGTIGSPAVDIRMTTYRQGIPTTFSEAALHQAEQAAVAVAGEHCLNRVDYRERPFVTIDGADAKDFDDAVALEQKEDGGCLLQVAIADVSHYVKEGSVLDREARERGTSVYFPGSCIPMLPEVLSNGICSLNPGEDRLVVVVEIEFDSQGKRLSIGAQRGVIRSSQRLTYQQAQQLVDGEVDADFCSEHVAMLKLMNQLACRLRNNRIQRGALDFDLPEAEFHLNDEGLATGVGRRTRLGAHQLIEEFMLTANEAVAELVLEHCTQGMFRVHDAPEPQKMQLFQQFIAAFNLGINLGEDGVCARELRQLLEQVEGTGVEYPVNRILLRSMKQARYDAENLGHFGLASDAYCHFTSPIRRYPDLVQHRMLVQILAGNDQWAPDQPFSVLADDATVAERRAMLAERDIADLRKCQFMADKIGQTFSGLITTVTAFGFFVELDEHFVEGLVHIRNLSDDYYSYDDEQHSLIGQARRRVFQVGMAVSVELWQVKPVPREIDFVLADLAGDVAAIPPRKASRRKRWKR